MTETKWLTGTEGEAMLDYVADRLSARHWMLLSTAYTRRLSDWVPDGVLRQAIEAVEWAEKPLPASARTEWLRRIDAAIPATVGAAEQAQREIVKSADPDSADQAAPILSRPNQVAPAFPLFAAASRQARNSVTWITDAMTEAAEAVRALFSEPSEEMLQLVRERVEQAVDTRTRANRAANLALRLKQEGDEAADRAAAAKNKHLEEAKATETARRIEESAGQSDEESTDRRERATRKQLARLLREVLGNPFTPPQFDPAWRSSTVVDLARGIFEDRAFDRLPILADALLDADCDAEAILRHCRGTEVGVKDQPQHVRGCWVVELILGRWQPLPQPAPGSKPRRRARRYDDLDIGLPFDRGDTGFA